MDKAVKIEALTEKMDEILRLLKHPRGALTAKEAASYLGVGVDKIYREVQSGRMRHRREERKLLFRPEWLDEWMKDGETVIEPKLYRLDARKGAGHALRK